MRAAFDAALRRARERAYPPGEFVGQESFMRAGEIRAIARAARIGPGVGVLDLCCGVAGPGRLIAREAGCDYLGVDADPEAVRIARDRAHGLQCRFEEAQIPPIPEGRFDVVLLLETVLAFRDKSTLFGQVAQRLADGGRFAMTLEEGAPLTDAERAAMPHAGTVWPAPLEEVVAALADVGLVVRHIEELTEAHCATAAALLAAFEADGEAICARVGASTLDDLLSSHRLWVQWLGTGRIRKFALVADR